MERDQDIVEFTVTNLDNDTGLKQTNILSIKRSGSSPRLHARITSKKMDIQILQTNERFDPTNPFQTQETAQYVPPRQIKKSHSDSRLRNVSDTENRSKHV